MEASKSASFPAFVHVCSNAAVKGSHTSTDPDAVTDATTVKEAFRLVELGREKSHHAKLLTPTERF